MNYDISAVCSCKAANELDEVNWSSVKELHEAYVAAVEQIRTLCRLARRYEEQEITREEFRRGWVDANNVWLAV